MALMQRYMLSFKMISLEKRLDRPMRWTLHKVMLLLSCLAVSPLAPSGAASGPLRQWAASLKVLLVSNKYLLSLLIPALHAAQLAPLQSLLHSNIQSDVWGHCLHLWICCWRGTP
jgi:hypothetical protein